MFLDPGGKGEPPVPHGRPVLVVADEGRVLDALVSQSGSTLLGTLCSAISGADFGQSNADIAIRRKVPAGTYRLAVILGIQPKHLSGVLTDVDGGVQQRFWFVRLTGHMLDADAEPPTDSKLALPDVNGLKFPGGFVGVSDDLRHLIRKEHVERMQAADRGEAVAGRSHSNLLRLRLAALLAIAAGRVSITDDHDGPFADWGLAGIMVDASDAVVALGEAMRIGAPPTGPGRHRQGCPSGRRIGGSY